MPLQATEITDAGKNKEQPGTFNRDPYEQWDNRHKYMQASPLTPTSCSLRNPAWNPQAIPEYDGFTT